MFTSPLTNFNLETNYWEIDPQMKVLEPFKSLYEEDKSKKKVDSSLIMWAIALFSDPESKLVKVPRIEKQNIILTDVIGNKLEDFKWDYYTEHIEAYRKLYMTQAQRSLTNLEEKLQERDMFLKHTKYNIDNGKDLDKILADTTKLYDLYDKLCERLSKEQAEGVGKGGAKESAAEKGLF